MQVQNESDPHFFLHESIDIHKGGLYAKFHKSSSKTVDLNPKT